MTYTQDADAAIDKILDVLNTADNDALIAKALVSGLRSDLQTANDQASLYRQALEQYKLTHPDVPVVTPPVTPAPRAKMALGATFDVYPGRTRQQTIDDLEAGVGALDAARVFISGAPTVANIAAAIAPHKGKRKVIISYKGDATDATLASIDNGGLAVYVVKYHEPENDGGTHTPAWYVAQQDAHIRQVQGIVFGMNLTPLIAAFVLMGWVDNDNDPQTNSAQWFPTIVRGVVMLLDPYPGAKELKAWVTITLNDLWRKYCADRGVIAQWGIAEIGTLRTGADGADWLYRALTYAGQEGAVICCYFHSAVAGNYWLVDTTMRAAFKRYNTENPR